MGCPDKVGCVASYASKFDLNPITGINAAPYVLELACSELDSPRDEGCALVDAGAVEIIRNSRAYRTASVVAGRRM